MHRLTVLFHYIVGNINQIVDRTDSHRSQSSLHPLGRRPKLNILYHSGCISWTEIRILYGNLDIVIHVLSISCGRHHRRMKFPAEGCGRFPCNSNHTVAVHAVRGNLIFKHHVIKPQCLYGAASHFHVLLENINSILRRLRIHIRIGAQLFDGAHHAGAWNAAEFSLLNLDSACHALSRLMASRHAAAV